MSGAKDMCKEPCWYLYPTDSTLNSGDVYMCHCGSCPAFCINCKHDCKKGIQGWCEKFEFDDRA